MSGPCTTLLICHKDALCLPSCLCRSVRVEDDDEYNASSEGGTQNYYGLAHTITETVTEQASIMINGRLKEYQVSTGLLSGMLTLKSCAVRSLCVSASSKQHRDVAPLCAHYTPHAVAAIPLFRYRNAQHAPGRPSEVACKLLIW